MPAPPPPQPLRYRSRRSTPAKEKEKESVRESRGSRDHETSSAAPDPLGSTHSHRHSDKDGANTDVDFLYRAGTEAQNDAAPVSHEPAWNRPASPPSSFEGQRSAATANTETLRATVSALRAENAVLRQRVAVLSSSSALSTSHGSEDAAASLDVHIIGMPSAAVPSSTDPSSKARRGLSPVLSVSANSAMPPPPLPGTAEEPSTEVLLLRARVRRLETALQVEATERDALEKRVLAQERVLQGLQLRLLEES